MFRIRVSGEGTFPPFHPTRAAALDAYQTLHADHCRDVGTFVLEEVVPLGWGDLLPDLKMEMAERLSRFGCDTSALDEIDAPTWDDLQQFLGECVAEWAKLTGHTLEAVRVVHRETVRIREGD